MYAVLSLQGKEFETRLKEKKPGDLSDELRIALGMPVGPVSAINVLFPFSRNNAVKTITTARKVRFLQKIHISPYTDFLA